MFLSAKIGANFNIMAVKAIIFDASDVLYGHDGTHKPMMDLIAELHKKYKIGMVTNLMKSSVDRIFSDKEQTMFSYIHTYGKSDQNKPSPSVFTHTAEEMYVRPQDCIYVDDRYENTHGAEQAGMQTIVYKDFEIFDHHLKQLLKDEE